MGLGIRIVKILTLRVCANSTKMETVRETYEVKEGKREEKPRKGKKVFTGNGHSCHQFN